MNVKSTMQWATPYSLGLLLALADRGAGWFRAAALGLGAADRDRPGGPRSWSCGWRSWRSLA